jgi:glutamine synthetase
MLLWHPRRFRDDGRGHWRCVAQPYSDEFEPTTAERIGRNDAVFREANEGIAEAAEEYRPDGRIPFICECAEPTCTEIVRLTLEEYQQVRSDPRTFLNAIGHQVAARGWGKVVAEEPGYVVVRKIGRAGEVAAELADAESVELVDAESEH